MERLIKNLLESYKTSRLNEKKQREAEILQKAVAAGGLKSGITNKLLWENEKDYLFDLIKFWGTKHIENASQLCTDVSPDGEEALKEEISSFILSEFGRIRNEYKDFLKGGMIVNPAFDLVADNTLSELMNAAKREAEIVIDSIKNQIIQTPGAPTLSGPSFDFVETLEKLKELKAIIDNEKGFRSKKEFLDWGSRVEPLLAFNPSYQEQFASALSMIHANLSSQTATPLANRMRTTLSKAVEQLKHETEKDTTNQPEAIKLMTVHKSYIHPDRIKQLKDISSDKFDLCKLLRFCEELNECHRANNFFAIILLTRALIDHIPPIFGVKTFNEVVSNYSGTRSFKENMDRLNTSCRKIADQHLHTPIRKSESLPTMTQVDFSNDIDVLLAEIHRILKRP
jgi:hypothetical protein